MDKIYFSGKEILEMALRIELNGEIFYREASKKTEDETLKELFIYLQNQEKKHYQDFKNLSYLIEKESVEGLHRLSEADEISFYLNTFADSKVFTDAHVGASLGRDVQDDSEAIDIAIGLERDSIIFYSGMLGIIKEEDKGLIENIIAQEKDHERLLMEIKEK
jgi:rubrerythrin